MQSQMKNRSLLFLLVTCAHLTPLWARRPQWYLTGQEAYNTRTFSKFPAQNINRWDSVLAHGEAAEVSINHTELTFGGALAVLEAKSSGNVSVSVSLADHIETFLATLLLLPREREGDTLNMTTSLRQHITVAYTFGIFVTKDYEHPFGLEIGLIQEPRCVCASINWGMLLVLHVLHTVLHLIPHTHHMQPGIQGAKSTSASPGFRTATNSAASRCRNR